MFRTYALLNVVAHPHPMGVYRKIFEVASEQSGVKVHGGKYAAISRITETEDGVFRGRLATWTEIEPTSPTVDKTSFEEKSLSEAGIELPANIGFNSSIFYFAFREKEHALYLELANDEGRSITPNIAKKAFMKILVQASENIEEVDDLSVYVSAKSDAVNYVLQMPNIRKITIDLNLPNPDDLTKEQQDAIDQLNDMNAKRLQSTITRAPGEETLFLVPAWRAVSELAQNNGSVSTEGTDANGKKDVRSTKDMAAEIVEEIGEGDSSFRAVFRVAREGRELGPNS